MSVDTSLVAQMGKNLLAMRETWVRSLGWEDHLEEGMATHFSILPGEFHGQRSLAGYNLWGRQELDAAEQLSTIRQHLFCFALSCIKFKEFY